MKKKFVKRRKKEFLLLYLGFGLFVVFLFLWFITLPEEELEFIDIPLNRSFEELTAKEQLEVVEEREQDVKDDAYYRSAIRTNNNAYCERIEDSDLRSACLSEVTSHEEIVADTRSTSEVMDSANYDLARRLGDVSYCDLINDESIRESCLNHFE